MENSEMSALSMCFLLSGLFFLLIRLSFIRLKLWSGVLKLLLCKLFLFSGISTHMGYLMPKSKILFHVVYHHTKDDVMQEIPVMLR